MCLCSQGVHFIWKPVQAPEHFVMDAETITSCLVLFQQQWEVARAAFLRAKERFDALEDSCNQNEFIKWFEIKGRNEYLMNKIGACVEKIKELMNGSCPQWCYCLCRNIQSDDSPK